MAGLAPVISNPTCLHLAICSAKPLGQVATWPSELIRQLAKFGQSLSLI